MAGCLDRGGPLVVEARMWLEWLSHTLRAPARLPPAERGRRSDAEGADEIDRRRFVGEAGARQVPLASRPIVLEPVEPHRS